MIRSGSDIQILQMYSQCVGPAECLEPSHEVVGGEDVGEVCSQMALVFVVEVLDRGLLNGAV